VNLLSHYYIDEAEPSVYFKLGLLLPDLIPGFNQKLRRSVFVHQSSVTEHVDLLEGIKKHYAVDLVFHQSEEFAFFCNLVQAALQEEQFPSFQHRKYFMAHIFVEKLIDRVLVKHSPQLSVKIQHDLEAVKAGVLTSYFSRIGKPAIQQEFFNNFNRLLSGTFLHVYADNEMFVKALCRVYQRINPTRASQSETENLTALVEAFENNHWESLLEIFDTVNEGLAVYA